MPSVRAVPRERCWRRGWAGELGRVVWEAMVGWMFEDMGTKYCGKLG